jgi:F-type H+-transporting ATPase subunit delta
MARFRATPYAKALHEVILAQCPHRVEEVVGELERLAGALDTVPDFHRVLVTPMVAVETKTAILDQVLDSLQITDPTRRFVHVVQRHYRMQHIPQIVEVYREIVDRSLGRKRARVEVPVVLAAEQQSDLLAVLEGVVGAAVVADFVDNPELLAGFRVQVGSKVFDGSLVGQLQRLSRQTQYES